MSPLPPLADVRSTVARWRQRTAHTLAAWLVAAADALTSGAMTRTLGDVDHDQPDGCPRSTVAEFHLARVRRDLSDAREDLAQIGRTLATRHLITRTGGPHLVRQAVDAALGPDADGPIVTVADSVAIAVRTWTSQPGKVGLLETECTELGWVGAAAVVPFLRDDFAAVAAAGEQTR